MAITAENLPTLLMEMMKDKEEMVRSLVQDMDSCHKNENAFKKLVQTLEDGKSVNQTAVNKALAKSSRHVNGMNQKLILLLLVYVAAGECTTDVAKLLNKLGHGEEALKEMMRQKMQGNP